VHCKTLCLRHDTAGDAGRPVAGRSVDELIVAGVVASRSEAVRTGLEQLVERHRRIQGGARIVEGCQSRSQTEEEVGWADRATIEMIADEPW
jgi:Arc/MetJ-type ribon-helix-helix transcriptional regulator